MGDGLVVTEQESTSMDETRQAVGWQAAKDGEQCDAYIDLEKVSYGHVWKDAQARFDLCVHYRRYFNVPKDLRTKDDGGDEDYSHICSIAEEVDDLLTILKMAREKMGGDWDGEHERLEKVLLKHGYREVEEFSDE